VIDDLEDKRLHEWTDEKRIVDVEAKTFDD